MEPRNENFVFQNVIGDDQPKGSWESATWHGPYDVQGQCHEYGFVPGEIARDHLWTQLNRKYLVTQGDILTAIFDSNLNNGEWDYPWHLTPGIKGAAACEKSGSGGVNVAFPNQCTFTDVCSSPPLLIFNHMDEIAN
jgi:hypothetical protein